MLLGTNQNYTYLSDDFIHLHKPILFLDRLISALLIEVLYPAREDGIEVDTEDALLSAIGLASEHKRPCYTLPSQWLYDRETREVADTGVVILEGHFHDCSAIGLDNSYGPAPRPGVMMPD